MRSRRVAQAAALWGGAATMALAGHGGVALMLHRAPSAELAGLPEAVAIDLLPLPPPEAPPEPPNEPPPGPQPELSPEHKPAPVPEPLPEALPEPEAAKEPAPAPDPGPAPRPLARPDPRKPHPPQPKRREAPTKPAPQTRPMPAQTQQAVPAGTRAQVADWRSQVQSRVARHMQRTRIQGRSARVQAMLRLDVGATGTVTARLATSTGNSAIDAAIARQAARMPRLPPTPDGRAATLTVPVVVQMN